MVVKTLCLWGGLQTFPKLCPHLNQAQGRVGKFYNLNRRSDKMLNSFGYPLCTVAIRGKISLQVALVLMIARAESASSTLSKQKCWSKIQSVLIYESLELSSKLKFSKY